MSKCRKIYSCGVDMSNYQWILNNNKRGIIPGLLWEGGNIIINLPVNQNPLTQIKSWSDYINSNDPKDHPQLDIFMERAVQAIPTLNGKMKYVFTIFNKLRRFRYNRKLFIYTSFDITDPNAYPRIPTDVDGILNVIYKNYDNTHPAAADCTLGKEGSNPEKMVINDTFIIRIAEQVNHIDITMNNGAHNINDIIGYMMETIATAIPQMDNLYNISINENNPRPAFGSPGMYNLVITSFNKLTAQPPVIQPIISIVGGPNMFFTAVLPSPFNAGVFISDLLVQPVRVGEMNVYIFTPGTILHEMCHFFGMVHTHQILDHTNPFIGQVWDIERIIGDQLKQGIAEEKATEFAINNYVRPAFINPASQGFDRDSVMTYPVNRNYSSANIEIKGNFFLSSMDLEDLENAYRGQEYPGVGNIKRSSNTISYNNYYNIYIFFGTLLILFFIWRLLH